jgi:quercetin dioxygenase-like cupin family protein
MHLNEALTGPIDLTDVPLHLGLGARATAVEGFGWDPAILDAYSGAVAADGAEGRLVMIFPADADWTAWERHPAGDEVVICLSGRMTLIQDTDGHEQRIDLTAGTCAINRPGVWHTADVHEPGQFMTITPGQGTEHRPR